MANECLCGRRHIEAETMRFIVTINSYLEWDIACPYLCGDTEIVKYIDRETGLEKTCTPNELWVFFEGGADQVGLMTDGSV